MREKLIELLRTAIHNDLNAFAKTAEIADHLIANGVVVLDVTQDVTLTVTRNVTQTEVGK